MGARAFLDFTLGDTALIAGNYILTKAGDMIVTAGSITIRNATMATLTVTAT